MITEFNREQEEFIKNKGEFGVPLWLSGKSSSSCTDRRESTLPQVPREG
jgi:hypothetical protein